MAGPWQGQDNNRYKVLPRLGDRELLKAMIEGHDMSAFVNGRVYEAWKYFHRHVQHLSRKDTEESLVELPAFHLFAGLE